MKRILLLLALVVATGATYAQEKAKVYFIAYTEIQTGAKAWSNMANKYLQMDGEKVCALSRNGLYGVIEVEPGEHEFANVNKNDKGSGTVTVKLEPGGKYYFASFVSQPIWELMPATGERILLQKDIQKADCKEKLKD